MHPVKQNFVHFKFIEFKFEFCTSSPKRPHLILHTLSNQRKKKNSIPMQTLRKNYRKQKRKIAILFIWIEIPYRKFTRIYLSKKKTK